VHCHGDPCNTAPIQNVTLLEPLLEPLNWGFHVHRVPSQGRNTLYMMKMLWGYACELPEGHVISAVSVHAGQSQARGAYSVCRKGN